MGADDFTSFVPRYYLSTAVGNCPRLLRSSLHCPTGSKSSMSLSPRPGLQLPCIKLPGSVDGLWWLPYGTGCGCAGSASLSHAMGQSIPLPLIILLTCPLAFVGQSPVVYFYEKGLDSFQAMALVWENSLRTLILRVMAGPS